MAIGLVPYKWLDMGGGYHAWTPGVQGEFTSGVDVRPLALKDRARGLSDIGYGLIEFNGPAPEGTILLGDNVTRNKLAWKRHLGYSPKEGTPQEMLVDHCLNGADEEGELSFRPMRCRNPETYEVHFAGRITRHLSGREIAQQVVIARRDLDRLFDQVERGELPEEILGKVLQSEAQRFRMDPEEMKGAGSRWKGVKARRPETSVTDEGNAGGSITLAAYGWTIYGTAGSWTTGSGVFVFTQAANNSVFALHPTSMSASHNYASTACPVTGTDPCGPLCRFSGTSTATACGYTNDNNSGLRTYSVYNGSGTLIGSTTSGSAPFTRRIDAINSTIRTTDNASTWRTSISDSTNSVGTRIGMHGYGNGSAVTVNTFTARDYVTPTVTSILPAAGLLAGGTAVVITGTNIEATATATIGVASITGVSVTPETTISGTAPSGTAGAKNVVVTNQDSGFTGTLTSGYTYSNTPTVPTVSASAGVGFGGTAQMVATSGPITAWSLQGSPPAGTSIDSAGLVTWPSSLTVGSYSITVRATNAYGSGDGTLSLTILTAETVGELVIADNVLESSVTSGTGPLILTAIPGFRRFSEVCLGTGDTVPYRITEGTDWEIGVGQYAGANTLARVWPQESSNGGDAVSFTTDPKEVVLTFPAARLKGVPTRNLVLNSSMRWWNRGVSLTLADKGMGPDGWFVLSESGGVTCTPDSNWYGAGIGKWAVLGVTSTQRVGFGQVLYSQDIYHSTGGTEKFWAQCRVETNSASRIRMAILMGTGTVDSQQRDFVNNWSSTSYTAGSFFHSSWTPLAVISQPINGIFSFPVNIPNSPNNIGIFIWTESQLTSGGSLAICEPILSDIPVPQKYYPPDYSEEGRACSERYWSTFETGVTPAQNVGNLRGAYRFVTYGTGDAEYGVVFPVRMRKAPTVVSYNPVAANANWYDSTAGADRVASVGAPSQVGVRITCTVTTSTRTNHNIHVSAEAEPCS